MSHSTARRLAAVVTGLALATMALPAAHADDDYGPEPKVIGPSATLFSPAPVIDTAGATTLRHGIDVEGMWHERDQAGQLKPGDAITTGEITYVYTAAQPAFFDPGGGVPVRDNWDVWVPQGVDLTKPGAFAFMVHKWDRPGGGASQSVYGGDLLRLTNVGEEGTTELRWAKHPDSAPFTSSAVSIRPPAGGIAHRSYGLEPFKHLWGQPKGFGATLDAGYTGKDPELIEHQHLISLVASMTPTEIQQAYDPGLSNGPDDEKVVEVIREGAIRALSGEWRLTNPRADRKKIMRQIEAVILAAEQAQEKGRPSASQKLAALQQLKLVQTSSTIENGKFVSTVKLEGFDAAKTSDRTLQVQVHPPRTQIESGDKPVPPMGIPLATAAEGLKITSYVACEHQPVSVVLTGSFELNGMFLNATGADKETRVVAGGFEGKVTQQLTLACPGAQPTTTASATPSATPTASQTAGPGATATVTVTATETATTTVTETVGASPAVSVSKAPGTRPGLPATGAEGAAAGLSALMVLAAGALLVLRRRR